MDLQKILSELYAERQRVGKIIKTLEELHSQPAGRTLKKRGRKGMDHAARQAVSQRMKSYWASRRGQGQQTNQ